MRGIEDVGVRVPGFIALASAMFLSTSAAHAAFSQAQCPILYYDTAFPVDLGATDYNYDVNNASRYALREHQDWQLLVNSNIAALQVGYQNFVTEPTYDYIKINGGYGDNYFSGNLGSNTYVLYPRTSGALVPSFGVTWHSDYSVNFDGMPKFSTAAAKCYATIQPTGQHGEIVANTRYDGFLIKTGDVIYVKFYQGPQARAWITLDTIAGTTGVDFDLYASTSTALPDDSSYTWRDYRGTSGSLDTAGASIVLSTPSTSRWVYIGVHSYSGAGHFVLRANEAYQGGMTPNLIVCSPGVNMQTSPYLAAVTETLGKTFLRTTQLAHGNYQPTGWTYKQIPDTGSQYCLNDSTCNLCMTPPSAPDYCGLQSSGGRTRIPYHTCGLYSYPDMISLSLAHELGHSRFGLADEYNPWGVANAHFCGHAIMNGPTPNSDKFCVGMNHCYEPGSGTIGPPAGFDCSASGSDWAAVINNLGIGSFYTWPSDPTTTSAQPWRLFFRNNYARTALSVAYQ